VQQGSAELFLREGAEVDGFAEAMKSPASSPDMELLVVLV
jgi:hypothetical protein